MKQSLNINHYDAPSARVHFRSKETSCVPTEAPVMSFELLTDAARRAGRVLDALFNVQERTFNALNLDSRRKQ